MQVQPPMETMAVPVFKTDRAVGILVLVVAAVSLLAGLGGILFGAAAGPIFREVSKPEPGGDDSWALLADVPKSIGAGSAVLALTSILYLTAGYCLYRSSRKSSILAMVAALVGVVGGPPSLLMGVGIASYAGLRLWGNAGPKPV